MSDQWKCFTGHDIEADGILPDSEFLILCRCFFDQMYIHSVIKHLFKRLDNCRRLISIKNDLKCFSHKPIKFVVISHELSSLRSQ
jgi:hypothetical protein